MCGIVGRFSVEPMPFTADLWDDLVDVMWRRGPDDRGVLFDARCVLGVRRLAVMDISQRGHLPMRSPCDRFRLAFNGELYNFYELRAALSPAGYRFRSAGDSEVVLCALMHWGIGALTRFNGMFALAFHDRVSQTLTLARDHAGIKPLYVLTDPRGLVFASQFDQIMSHPWAAGRSIDPEAVAMYLRLSHIPAPRGYLTGTGMLPAGSWLRIDSSGRSDRGRYFTFGPGEPVHPAQDEIEATLRAAVARQSVSDVPAGSLLSGGIDSPLIASYLADFRTGPVPTFSIAMQDRELDESADANRYATAIGSAHRVRTMGSEQVSELFADAIAATCEPLADEGILPSLLAAGLARESVTVVLSGEGGDELFWGYQRRHLAMLRPDGAAAGHFGHRYLRFYSEFTQPQFTACFPGLEWWPDGEPGFDRADPADPAEFIRDIEFNIYLPFILLTVDRASMHHSLELRVPLLDREVIALASRLGRADCLDLAAGKGKVPLRRALRSRTGFATTGKRPFTAPIDAWVRTVLREEVSASLRNLRGLESVDVNTAELAGLFRRHCTGEEDNGWALWRILCLDRWVGKRLASENLGAPCGR